ncbi:MAG: hypothetical protein IPK72_17950 [Candidatus Eisenbacteria bacterium]|nr:hypothetical protein [Candidatus Eisenbacteria bacterium]
MRNQRDVFLPIVLATSFSVIAASSSFGAIIWFNNQSPPAGTLVQTVVHFSMRATSDSAPPIGIGGTLMRVRKLGTSAWQYETCDSNGWVGIYSNDEGSYEVQAAGCLTEPQHPSCQTLTPYLHNGDDITFRCDVTFAPFAR